MKKFIGIPIKLILVFVVIVFLITSSAIVRSSNFTNDSLGEYVTQKILTLEIWANTFLNIESNEELQSIDALLSLDNGTLMSDQEIKFYLDDDLLDSSFTDENGSAKFNFNSEIFDVGNYSFKAVFNGSGFWYLNPSSVEKDIFIVEQNGEKKFSFIGKGYENVIQEILLNETNESIETLENISFSNIICQNFEEKVIWSSGYSLESEGSSGYEVWYPNYNCSELNSSYCFVGDIGIETRFISTGLAEEGVLEEGYVQISNLAEGLCNNFDSVNYTTYLARDSLEEESISRGYYCGENKSSCNLDNPDNYAYRSCYGIKIYSSQYFVTDVLAVNYTLCSEGGSYEN